MQPPAASARLTAILQAVLVTFLWSTSWVLVKIALRGNLPPLTFAGLRYGLACLCLAPFVLLNRSHRNALAKIPLRIWLQLTLLGIVYYALAQGALFIGLAYLPAVLVNLLLNLSPALVALMSLFALKEPPGKLQWAGIPLAAIGTGIYFLPFTVQSTAFIGLAMAAVAVLTSSIGILQGRQANRDFSLPPLLITFVSMGLGALLLLGTGLAFQGLGQPTLQDWGIIAWLAIVNTAFAFTLWNTTLRVLTAVESSILNSLMMPQIAILAVIFLGEKLAGKEIIGLILVGIGVIVVQLKQKRKRSNPGGILITL